MPPPKGHPRYGGGIKKGQKWRKTLEKEAVLAAVRQLVMQQANEMVGAQIEHAKGVHYTVLRREDGSYARATDEAAVDRGAREGAQLFTQAPNTQAFTALMDRTFGKPQDNVALEVSGNLNIVGTLAKRHRRIESD